MNAVVMDEVELGDECIIGALTLVKAREKIPARSLVVGNPGKILKEVSDEMMSWKTEGTAIYQNLPADCFNSLRPVLPLTKTEKLSSASSIQGSYKPWKSDSGG